MRRISIMLLGLVMMLVGGLWLFQDAYGKNIAGAAEDIAVNMVSGKINASLREGFYSETFTQPLLRVERDKNGRVQYIEPDTGLINRLVMDFAGGVKESYNPDEIARCKVNLGVLTGSRFLSQLPIRTTIKVQPLSLTKITCSTGFESQGINQTRYYVRCDVESRIRVLAPFTNETAQIRRSYQIAEAVIVGQVPDSYVVVPEESILDAMEF